MKYLPAKVPGIPASCLHHHFLLPLYHLDILLEETSMGKQEAVGEAMTKKRALVRLFAYAKQDRN